MSIFLAVPLAETLYETALGIIPFPDILILTGLIILMAIAYISNIPKEASLMLAVITVFGLITLTNFMEQIWVLTILVVGLALGLAWIGLLQRG